MKKLKLFIASLAVVMFGAAALVPATVGAIDPLEGACTGQGQASSELCNDRDGESANNLIGTVVNTLLYVVGILSVIMIIVAGVMYTTSSGDSGRVAKAKNTLTYSIVGLVVAILAYAIVNWVFTLL